MGNLSTYIKKYGNKLFDELEPNVLDYLALTIYAYIDFKDCFKPNQTVGSLISKRYEGKNIKKERLGLIVPKRFIPFSYSLKDYKRFKDIPVLDYKDILDDETQFAAFRFEVKNYILVSFRGTDDSVVGWKENFSQILAKNTKAEILAALYVDQTAKLYPNKKIIIAGHSKGGNLALFSSIFTNYQDNILTVYNFDGQGLYKKEISEEIIDNIVDRIIEVAPHASIVGNLFETYTKKKLIVKSNIFGFLQHDALSWRIKDKDFLYTDNYKKRTLKFIKIVNSYLEEMGEIGRANLVLELNSYFDNLGYKYLLEFVNIKRFKEALKEAKFISAGTRKLLFKTLFSYISHI